jgi:acid phosphatase family membrane protein YuiD
MRLPDSPLLAAASCAILIQIAKFVSYWVIHRRVNFQRLVQTGGMPSSHAGSVAALSGATGISAGFDSTVFQVAAFFSIIVVYDAAGLRRAAGMQAQVLNRLVDRMHREHRLILHGARPLAELLGHTPFEVLVGILFGVVFAWSWYVFVS